ncbi:endonuclease domain-containing protein [Streptacidiphilus griseoplanus]|uniref:endonuclease domain-containing protein n=1 Tax=Peterkaempfera griseoplana TaxID=66896 RepID=UPI0006E3FA4E|nr:endonuclease domain-containing protein [Peterkaempfera griseoplana]
MLISLGQAQKDFLDLIRDPVLPVDASVLRSDWFRQHGHILLGPTPIRGIKTRGRWYVDDREVRVAARAINELTIDADDLVPIRIDWRNPENHDWPWRPDWRLRLRWTMVASALQTGTQGSFRELFDQGEKARTVRVWMRRLTNEPPRPSAETDAAIAREPLVHAWALTAGPPVRTKGSWMMPRTVVDLLDRCQALDERLIAAARRCVGCYTDGGEEASWKWRAATSDGWVTKCPACAVEEFPEYTSRFRGVRYDSPRRKAVRADEYRCCLCGTTRAAVWDHCHDHGYVRGPLCASCNASEWAHTLREEQGPWLNRANGIAHLLRCAGCSTAKMLPDRYRVEVVRRHVEAEAGQCRCKSRRAEVREGHEDALLFAVRCFCNWRAPQLVTIPFAEADSVVRALLESVQSGE